MEAETPEIFKLDLDMIEVAARLTRLLERDLARRFEQVPGVGAINVNGGIYREIRADTSRGVYIQARFRVYNDGQLARRIAPAFV